VDGTRHPDPARRVTCLDTTGCAACAAGFGLAAGADGATCLAAAAAPAAALPTDLSTPVALALALPTAGQGLTLVHFSAQPEPVLTQNTP